MRRGLVVTFVILVAVIVGGALYASTHPQKAQNRQLQVVAAENFWGSLISQIGGSKIHVTSIVSDPNADPHEYESNAADARAVATANYVIMNGVGYDDWMGKLLGASPNSSRLTLNIANLVGVKGGQNPHLWYDPSYVNTATAAMEHNLITLDPADRGYFLSHYAALQSKLAVYQDRTKSISQQFAGTKVAATEDIFSYLAQAAGLNLISPSEFIEAVSEGNDPPASSVVTFQQQLQSGQVKALVYNEQTVTLLTNSIKQLAAQQNIPIVGVTETIQPPDASFEVWMNAELIDLQNAFNAQALGR
ncbi:MAG TPA: zinc ABC transporter substrate-binding protein [Candidatus Saccharimonadales bacterium]|nr:zinc ABC transporter substrate-binding protein [Candidatus Saccharimonadales bacterium]